MFSFVNFSSLTDHCYLDVVASDEGSEQNSQNVRLRKFNILPICLSVERIWFNINTKSLRNY